MFNPRPYQTEATNAVINGLLNIPGCNPIVALPGGTGKSIVIAQLVKTIKWHWPQKRSLMCTHSQDLVEQNLSKIISMLPEVDIGVYSAGLKRKEHDHQVVYGNIQSMGKKGELFGFIDVLYIDECHRLSDRETSLYQILIIDLLKINPNLKVVGFTATPYRQGMGLLTDGTIFTHIVYDKTGLDDFNWFLAEGYLSTLSAFPTATFIDTSKVGLVGGEFNQKQLQAEANKEEITWAGLQELAEKAFDRDRWLIFGVGIKHVNNIAAMLDAMGIPAEGIHSRRKDSRDVMAAHRRGEFRALVNDGIATTGYDDPLIDCIALFRPIRSVSLHVQMLSRGTRPVFADGYDLDTREGRLDAIKYGPKPNGCLVLDFGQNIARLGPINDPQVPKRRGKMTGELPIKICNDKNLEKDTGAWPEGCGQYNHPTTRICEGCGGTFIFKIDLDERASKQDVVAKKAVNMPPDPIIQKFPVDKVTYERKSKTGRPLSMLVTYYSGLRRFPEYICLDHSGYPAKKARDWWRGRNNQLVPNSTEDGFNYVDSILEPKSITVDVALKHPEIQYGSF